MDSYGLLPLLCILRNNYTKAAVLSKFSKTVAPAQASCT